MQVSFSWALTHSLRELEIKIVVVVLLLTSSKIDKSTAPFLMTGEGIRHVIIFRGLVQASGG